MVNDYKNMRFILKTPDGYLTYGGTTDNINCLSIIILNLPNIGGINYNKRVAIERFLNQSTASYPIEECELMYYNCLNNQYWNCFNCPDEEYCGANRKACDIYKMPDASIFL